MLEGFQPVSVDTFGSLTTVIDRADVAVGLSPANQNCKFFIGGAASRNGLITHCYKASVGRTSTFDDYVTSALVRGRVILTDSGYLLWQTGEDSAGTTAFTTIESGLGTGLVMKSVRIGKRLYMALSDGKYGVAPPRQYDGTYLDTIGTEGPVAYPTWSEESGAASNWTIGIHRMVIAYETRDGLITIPSDGEDAQFQVYYQTYDNTGALPAFTSWPIGPPGTIRRRMYVTPAYTAPVPWNGEQVAGVDYYTHPDLWLNDNTTVNWNGPGVSDSTLMSEYTGDISNTKLVKIRPLPMVAGLATYAKRLIAWGALNEVPRLYPGSGVGEWATPGSMHMDGGTIPAAYPNWPWGWISEFSGGYAGTTITDQSAIPGGTGQILKITGDGSTATRGALHTTHSVKRIITLAPGETTFGARVRLKRSSDFNGTFNVWVDGVGTKGYQECGLSGKTGATATGLSTTTTYYFKANIDGTGIVEHSITTAADVTYTAVMALMNAQMGSAGTWSLVGGDLRCTATSYSTVSSVSLSAGTTGTNLFATLTGFTSFDTAVVGTGGVAIPYASMSTDWTNVEGASLFTSALPDSAVGDIHISATGTPANNSWVAIDRIDVYPASQPKLPGRLFISELNDYETFVAGDDSELPVHDGDGEAILCCYELRGVFRVAKEHSLWSVTDNGDVPGNWPVELASDSVGTMSLFGAAPGDGWAVIADQSGLFLDSGGMPEKISHEIQPNWDAIDWSQGHLVRVAVDLQNKLVFVLAPTTTTKAYCDKLFVMDYQQGFGDPIEGAGTGRKWTIWTIPADTNAHTNHIAYVLRDNGQRAIMLGGGMTSAQMFIVKPDPSSTPKTYDNFISTSASDAVGFDAYYDTANIGGPTSRSLFGYATLTCTGAGTLKSTLIDLDAGTTVLPDRTLSSAEKNEVEIPFMKTTTKLALRLQTNPAGATTNGAFSVSRASLWAKRAPFSALRGY